MRAILLVLLAFAALPVSAQASYAPIVFWNVPNFYSGNWENIRYPDPVTAFTTDWEKLALHQCGKPILFAREEIFLDAFPVGNPPGSHYNAHAINRSCETGATSVIVFGSTARRWAGCTNTGPWYYSPDGLSCTTPPNKVDPELSRGHPCTPDCSYGDPINVAVGNKFEQRTEYEGRGAFPLRFGWTYNSSGSSIAAGPQELSLGRNRTHTFARAVRQTSNGTITTAYVLRPEGNTFRFNLVSGAWVPTSGVDGRLFSVPDASGAFAGWRYTSSNGDQELYNVKGQLVVLTGRLGLSQTLTYNEKGRLGEVIDPEGRRLAFSYNPQGNLSGLNLPDGNSIAFGYDASNNLATVTYPGGASIQYRYNESAYSVSETKPGALTGVIDEAQSRYSTTTYDRYTYATSTYLGSNIDRFDVTYTMSPNGYAPQASVLDSLGKRRIVSFAPYGGRARATSGADQCSSCPAGSVSYTYDASGRLNTETDLKGVVTDYDFNSSGLVTQKVEGANGL
ncbi:YD repeat-containing protein [Lysobacter niastensis]|uniref:YD repeat-containing protein n=1 Tax=Lysobacter niastensis TaxID=380629 RepID=A0ABU1WF23_9GAMM|nr:DUF6531 domain-containing protein [Lysobacter niastensis]MDR7136162.1 YD repeat-containing protein [Lysobacter niastensis]